MSDAEPRHEQLRQKLARSRPVPRGRFVTDLRRRLTDLEGRAGRPPYLWALIAGYLAAGLLLLALAAMSATGGGPFS